MPYIVSSKTTLAIEFFQVGGVVMSSGAVIDRNFQYGIYAALQGSARYRSFISISFPFKSTIISFLHIRQYLLQQVVG